MDRIKEFMETNKLKIILSLLIAIVALMVTLFIVMGQHDNDQNSMDSTAISTSTNNMKATSPSSGSNKSNHYQSQFIDVEGAVKRPGVYQFTSNMRIDDAVNLAGGLNSSADRRHINLAKKLIDQQTVYIPIKGEIKGLPGTSDDSMTNSKTISTNSDSSSGKINLNTADAKQLQSINGIGEKRAEKIVDYRKDHGEFKQVSDVKKVSGIGDKFLSNIKEHVTV